MPCSQQRPIGFIVRHENIQNGRICRSPEQRIHASVNHLMVQCVRPTTKIFTDFTSIDFVAVKIGCPRTARYGIDGLCTLLYAGFVYRTPIQRQILHDAVNCFTKGTSKQSVSISQLPVLPARFHLIPRTLEELSGKEAAVQRNEGK